MPLRPDRLDHLRQPRRELIRVTRDGRSERHTALPCPPERRSAIRVAQLHPTRLGGRQRLPGAPGDGLPLLLCDEGHDADCQVVGLGHVDREEADAAVAQGEQEGGIAGEAVELGDDRGGTGEPGEVEGLVKLGPVVALAAFDLGEAGDDLRSL